MLGSGDSVAIPIDSRIRVMVVEDDPLMRIAVELELEKLDRVRVVARISGEIGRAHV